MTITQFFRREGRRSKNSKEGKKWEEEVSLLSTQSLWFNLMEHDDDEKCILCPLFRALTVWKYSWGTDCLRAVVKLKCSEEWCTWWVAQRKFTSVKIDVQHFISDAKRVNNLTYHDMPYETNRIQSLSEGVIETTSKDYHMADQQSDNSHRCMNKTQCWRLERWSWQQIKVSDIFLQLLYRTLLCLFHQNPLSCRSNGISNMKLR
jgi:hypothetical protein